MTISPKHKLKMKSCLLLIHRCIFVAVSFATCSACFTSYPDSIHSILKAYPPTVFTINTDSVGYWVIGEHRFNYLKREELEGIQFHRVGQQNHEWSVVKYIESSNKVIKRAEQWPKEGILVITAGLVGVNNLVATFTKPTITTRAGNSHILLTGKVYADEGNKLEKEHKPTNESDPNQKDDPKPIEIQLARSKGKIVGAVMRVKHATRSLHNFPLGEASPEELQLYDQVPLLKPGKPESEGKRDNFRIAVNTPNDGQVIRLLPKVEAELRWVSVPYVKVPNEPRDRDAVYEGIILADSSGILNLNTGTTHKPQGEARTRGRREPRRMSTLSESDKQVFVPVLGYLKSDSQTDKHYLLNFWTQSQRILWVSNQDVNKFFSCELKEAFRLITHIVVPFVAVNYKDGAIVEKYLHLGSERTHYRVLSWNLKPTMIPLDKGRIIHFGVKFSGFVQQISPIKSGVVENEYLLVSDIERDYLVVLDKLGTVKRLPRSHHLIIYNRRLDRGRFFSGDDEPYAFMGGRQFRNLGGHEDVLDEEFTAPEEVGIRSINAIEGRRPTFTALASYANKLIPSRSESSLRYGGHCFRPHHGYSVMKMQGKTDEFGMWDRVLLVTSHPNNLYDVVTKWGDMIKGVHVHYLQPLRISDDTGRTQTTWLLKNRVRKYLPREIKGETGYWVAAESWKSADASQLSYTKGDCFKELPDINTDDLNEWVWVLDMRGQLGLVHLRNLRREYYLRKEIKFIPTGVFVFSSEPMSSIVVSSPSIAGLQIPQIKFGTWLEILEPVDTKQETDHETVLVRVWKNRVYSGGFGLPEDEFCLRVAQRPLKRGMIERNRRELEESDAIKAPLAMVQFGMNSEGHFFHVLDNQSSSEFVFVATENGAVVPRQAASLKYQYFQVPVYVNFALDNGGERMKALDFPYIKMVQNQEVFAVHVQELKGLKISGKSWLEKVRQWKEDSIDKKNPEQTYFIVLDGNFDTRTIPTELVRKSNEWYRPFAKIDVIKRIRNTPYSARSFVRPTHLAESTDTQINRNKIEVKELHTETFNEHNWWIVEEQRRVPWSYREIENMTEKNIDLHHVGHYSLRLRLHLARNDSDAGDKQQVPETHVLFLAKVPIILVDCFQQIVEKEITQEGSFRKSASEKRMDAQGLDYRTYLGIRRVPRGTNLVDAATLVKRAIGSPEIPLFNLETQGRLFAHGENIYQQLLKAPLHEGSATPTVKEEGMRINKFRDDLRNEYVKYGIPDAKYLMQMELDTDDSAHRSLVGLERALQRHHEDGESNVTNIDVKDRSETIRRLREIKANVAGAIEAAKVVEKKEREIRRNFYIKEKVSLKNALTELDDVRQFTLFYLLLSMRRVSDFSEYNLMTGTNVALMFTTRLFLQFTDTLTPDGNVEGEDEDARNKQRLILGARFAIKNEAITNIIVVYMENLESIVEDQNLKIHPS